VVENDANAAAWAETRFGAGHGQPFTVTITVGTGLGGGVVLGGELIRGAFGAAAADFTINATIVAPGGSQVEIISAGGGQHVGYLLDVVPVTYQGTQYTWAFGRYLFVLTVTRGVDQGQTVCAVFVH
jgi:hypothetical protein